MNTNYNPELDDYHRDDFYPDGYDPELADYPTGRDKRDIICLEIIPYLGEFKDDFDIEAIFNESYEYSQQLNGFYSPLTEEEFVEVIQKHDLTAK